MLFKNKQIKACCNIQRVFRGHKGRKDTRTWALKKAEIGALNALLHYTATTIQRYYRGYLGRVEQFETRLVMAQFMAEMRALEAHDDEKAYWETHPYTRWKRDTRLYIKNLLTTDAERNALGGARLTEEEQAEFDDMEGDYIFASDESSDDDSSSEEEEEEEEEEENGDGDEDEQKQGNTEPSATSTAESAGRALPTGSSLETIDEGGSVVSAMSMAGADLGDGLGLDTGGSLTEGSVTTGGSGSTATGTTGTGSKKKVKKLKPKELKRLEKERLEKERLEREAADDAVHAAAREVDLDDDDD